MIAVVVPSSVDNINSSQGQTGSRGLIATVVENPLIF